MKLLFQLKSFTSLSLSILICCETTAAYTPVWFVFCFFILFFLFYFDFLNGFPVEAPFTLSMTYVPQYNDKNRMGF